jgi:hypothetical protein
MIQTEKQIGDRTYISAREVARMLGVTARTIHKWSLPFGNIHRPRNAPDLKPFRALNGRILFRKDVIEKIQQEYFFQQWQSIELGELYDDLEVCKEDVVPIKDEFPDLFLDRRGVPLMQSKKLDS